MNATAFRAVAENCAPGVAPSIMEKLVAAESGFNPFAIGVNGPDRASYTPRSAEEAAQIASRLIAEGKSIDMGLGQINNANLSWLGLTPATVFDACRNLTAAETVLRDGYDRARDAGADQTQALHQALSSYNTGSFTRGFHNGYVARVLGEGSVTAPSIEKRSPSLSDDKDSAKRWDVFGAATGSNALVFQ